MNSIYYKYVKRCIDFMAALVVLMIFFPVIIIVAVLLWITHHRPVYFTQKRIGWNDKVFTVYKFKSMNDAKDEHGNLLPDAQRLTPFGKFIRKTSLDELPQLINVLKGDMSLIGPRPLLVHYLPLYSPEQRKRHLVRPGITGWAQVNGRNIIGWQKKFELDVWYVQHLNFGIDCKIVWLTIVNILKASGISQEGQATAEAFTGNNSES